jgi:hypothetical protein
MLTLTNGNRVEIIQDSSPENPRDWNNLSKMFCFSKRYNLGDDHNYDFKNFKSWGEFGNVLIKKYKPAVIKPLYVYDHSGLTISTKPFECRWDSYQVGFILIPEDVKADYGWKKLSLKRREKLEKLMLSELETYDKYLIGDVWGFKETDQNENEVNSCWGFYGDDYEKNGMVEYFSAPIKK